jgi:DNA ligase-1
MKAFAHLYARLDATTSNNAKLAAMIQYFKTAPPGDAAWGAYFLAGGKPRQLVPAKVLRQYAASRAGIPDWLFEESYQAVGDLAETLALLLPPGTQENSLGLASWMTERLLPLRGLEPSESMRRLDGYLNGLDAQARFVCGKLITGSFRVGVSRLLVTRALGDVAQVDAKRIAERMIGYTDISAQPDARLFSALMGPLSNEAAARDGDAAAKNRRH